MKRYQFPSISSWRGFESAARHLSFSRAASEMNLTPSAISHQIRQIEQLWQLELFDRHSGRMALTAFGQALAPIIHEFLVRLEHTLDVQDCAQDQNVLRVNVHESFAVTWLLPRLPRFYSKHPNIRVWLSTNEFIGFDAMQIDIAIRLGPSDWKRTMQEVLLREYMFPVCSPDLIRRFGRPREPADLLSFPLIVRHRRELDERRTPPPSWLDWFAKYGLNDVTMPGSVVVPHTSMAIQAAIEGVGVALVRSAHIVNQLEGGHLVALFAPVFPVDSAYCFLTEEGRQLTAPMRAFYQWLKQETAFAQAIYDRQATPAAIASDLKGIDHTSCRTN
jgi:LysR family transcriptional regulator, glycine cleavage system transcriptional activator